MAAPAKRLLTMIGCHVASGIGIAVGWIAWPPERSLTTVLYLALVFSESTLLGAWCIFARCALWWRMAGLLAGLTYLVALSWVIDAREIFIFATMIGTTFAMAFCLSLAARLRGIRLLRPGLDSSGLSPQEFQFSIGHLLVLTAIVAVSLAIGKDYYDPKAWSIAAEYGAALATAPLIAIWACLGIRHRTWGILLVPIVSFVAGFIPIMVASETAAPGFWWPITTLIEGVISMASLYVVRSCGYRLSRRVDSAPGPVEASPSI